MNDFDDFNACPSCFQEQYLTGKYFNVCMCTAKIARNRCAELIHRQVSLKGYELVDLFCGKCKKKKLVVLGLDSDYCSDGFSDEEVQEYVDNIQREKEDRLERDTPGILDQFCL
tara:strand:+ start:21251 stop:21592 length:342 start_codon:yes stop_codon:yes gene_type:complete